LATCLAIRREEILRDLAAGVAVSTDQLREFEAQLKDSFNRGHHV
jgi:hypothetical protein